VCVSSVLRFPLSSYKVFSTFPFVEQVVQQVLAVGVLMFDVNVVWCGWAGHTKLDCMTPSLLAGGAGPPPGAGAKTHAAQRAVMSHLSGDGRGRSRG
jgi:hypothetical protein